MALSPRSSVGFLPAANDISLKQPWPWRSRFWAICQLINHRLLGEFLEPLPNTLVKPSSFTVVEPEASRVFVGSSSGWLQNKQIFKYTLKCPSQQLRDGS